jgi:hypothetical protein
MAIMNLKILSLWLTLLLLILYYP